MAAEKMDKETRRKLCKEIGDAVRYALQSMSKEWIDEDELLKTFQFFSKYWLRRYGYALPRKKEKSTDPETNKSKSIWLYNKRKIQQMIITGEIQRIRVRKV